MRTEKENKVIFLFALAIVCLFLFSGCSGSGSDGTDNSEYSLSVEIVGQGAVEPEAGAYAAGAEVELTATPAQGWIFSHWQGDATGADNPLTITLDSNKAVSATFIEQGVKVLMKTTMGDMVFILYPLDAPATTDNFLQYVEDGFYDGTDGAGATIFHRVISGFVIQGGGMTEDMVRKTTRDPIAIESDNGLSNKRGTIAMARTSDPNSATSQFYVNLVDNHFLDYVSEAKPGYTVFGELESGFDVLDAIGAVSTTSEVPNDPIFITSVELVQ